MVILQQDAQITIDINARPR